MLTFAGAFLNFSALHAQVKKGFKYLESKEYDLAIAAFQKDINNGENALPARVGMMKAYLRSKKIEDWYLGMGFYKEANTMMAALDKETKKQLSEDYKVSKGSLDNTYNMLYGKILDKVELSTTPCDDIKGLGIFECPIDHAPRVEAIKEKCNPKPKVEQPKPAPKSIYVNRVPKRKNMTFIKNINTAGDEAVPVLSADGSTMYMIGSERPDNLSGEDVFYSERKADGTWGESKRDKFFSSPLNDCIISASGDGNQLVLFIDGTPHISNRTKTGWTKPQLIKLKGTYAWVGTVNISRNGEALLFEAQESNLESVDLYVALKDVAGEWGIPIKLPDNINSLEQERSPFLHSDFTTMYFSSAKPGGYGGLDVYKTTRLDNSWQRWSTPENLGSLVNSPEDDWGFYIPASGDMAYLATRLSGFKDLDIVSMPLEGVARPQPQKIIKGRLTNSKGKGLPGEITVEDATSELVIQKLRSRPDGTFSFSVPVDAKVLYYASGDSVITPQKTFVDAALDPNTTKEQNISIITIDEILKDNKAIELHDILFETNKAVLSVKAKAEIKRVYDSIKKYGWTIEVGGHTDNVGDNAKNLTLSQQRAQAVSAYMTSLGYSAKKLTSKGYGATVPVQPNDTDAGRALNRRVELKVKQ